MKDDFDTSSMGPRGAAELVKMNEDRTGANDWWLINTRLIGNQLLQSGDYETLFGESHEFSSIERPPMTSDQMDYYRNSQGPHPGSTDDAVQAWYNEAYPTGLANTVNIGNAYVVNSTDYYTVNPSQLSLIHI